MAKPKQKEPSRASVRHMRKISLYTINDLVLIGIRRLEENEETLMVW